MHQVLDSFEFAIQQISAKLEESQTIKALSLQARGPFEKIEEEEKELDLLRTQLRQKAKVLTQLKQKESTFILDHPSFPVKRMRERLQKYHFQEEEESPWQQLVKVNHQIKISVTIESIKPLLRSWGNMANEITFQALKFSLHHADKVSCSQTMRYDTRHNLFHRSHLVGGKILKNNRQFTLHLKHKIRNQNILLYSQQFAQSPITIIAQSDYGAIVGFAQFYLDELVGEEGVSKSRVLLFRKKVIEGGEFADGDPVFSARSFVTITSNPIAPELSELSHFATMDIKKRKNSRSISPTKILSSSPKQRSKSPKLKRKMIGNILKGPEKTVWLTVMQNRQYKYRLDILNPTLSRELVYRKVVNVKEKKIELVKLDSSFYLKFNVKKDNRQRPTTISLTFSSIQFQVNVVEDSLFQMIRVDQFDAMRREKERDIGSNKVVYLGGGNSCYYSSNSQIKKSIAPQEIEDCMLSSIFLKSSLEKCQIYVNRPFFLHRVVHRQNGYLITYFNQSDPIEGQVQTALVFYVYQYESNIKEVHVFDCLIKQRNFSRQTLGRQLQVATGEQFCKLSLKMIANEKYEYSVRSTEPQKIQVVNGTDFKYSGQNQCLVLQILKEETSKWHTDIVFCDDKGGCFFLRLFVRPHCS